MATSYLQPGPAPVQVPKARREGYLFGPVVDFLCLGGSSLLLLPFLLLLPVADYKIEVAAAMLLVAHVINHPHFAHSYQIFYRGYRAKAFTSALGREMQVRYLVSGLVVPVVMGAFAFYCLAAGDAQLLGQSGNVMLLLVGWHYVKQGYGMLMVDSALKKQYFSASEKKVLLANCYAVWIGAWLSYNDYVAEQTYWGLHYYTFDLPDALIWAGTAVAAATSLAVAWTLFKRWRTTGKLPVNGVVAYGVSLYVWMMFVQVNPVLIMIVPALHSIQYLLVVWRFQTNYERSNLADEGYKSGSVSRRLFGANSKGHLALFGLSGIVIGFIGFWALPVLLTAAVPYDKAIFGGTLFLFVGWIFINVHHYFLDTVMWRRENPDTKRYLFG